MREQALAPRGTDEPADADCARIDRQLTSYLARRLPPQSVADVKQEVWVTMSRYHQRHGVLPCAAYVHRIARGKVADHLAARHRRREREHALRFEPRLDMVAGEREQQAVPAPWSPEQQTDLLARLSPMLTDRQRRVLASLLAGASMRGTARHLGTDLDHVQRSWSGVLRKAHRLAAAP